MTVRGGSANGEQWPQTESLLLLRQVMDLGEQVRRVVASRTHLTGTEMHALEHLSRSMIGPAELARLLSVSTAASTGIVDRLQAKGHVTRRADPTDRRRTQVEVSEAAQAQVVAHLAPMFRGIAAADAALSEQERAVVVRYLRAAVVAADSVIGREAGGLPSGSPHGDS